MAKSKGAASRKKTSSKKTDDLVTIRYSTVVFYVFVGIIIGLSIGALALLWVADDKNGSSSSLNGSIESRVLQTNPYSGR